MASLISRILNGIKPRTPTVTQAAAPELAHTTSSYTPGFPKWEDPVIRLDRNAYTIISQCAPVVAAMKKIGDRLAARRVVAVPLRDEEPHQLYAEKVNKLLIEQSIGLADAIKWLAWASVEGVRFVDIVGRNEGPWLVPDMRGGGRRKLNAGGNIEWDGRSIVKVREHGGLGPGVTQDDQDAQLLERERIMVWRPGAGSSPEGDLELAIVLYNIARNYQLLEKNLAEYSDRHVLPIRVFMEKVQGLRPDQVQTHLSTGAEKFQQASRGGTMALDMLTQAVKNLEPSGTTSQILIDFRRELESQVHKLLLNNATSTGPVSMGPDQRGDSEVHQQAEDVMLENIAHSMEQGPLIDLADWLRSYNYAALDVVARQLGLAQPPRIRLSLDAESEEKGASPEAVRALYDAGAEVLSAELYGAHGMQVPEGVPPVIKKEQSSPFGDMGGFGGGGFGGGSMGGGSPASPPPNKGGSGGAATPVSLTSSDGVVQLENRWITIGGGEDEDGNRTGGRRVQIDEQGRIVKGLSEGAQGKTLEEAFGDTEGTFRSDGPSQPESGASAAPSAETLKPASTPEARKARAAEARETIKRIIDDKDNRPQHLERALQQARSIKAPEGASLGQQVAAEIESARNEAAALLAASRVMPEAREQQEAFNVRTKAREAIAKLPERSKAPYIEAIKELYGADHAVAKYAQRDSIKVLKRQLEYAGFSYAESFGTYASVPTRLSAELADELRIFLNAEPGTTESNELQQLQRAAAPEITQEIIKAARSIAQQLAQGKQQPKIPESTAMAIAKVRALADLAGRARTAKQLEAAELMRPVVQLTSTTIAVDVVTSAQLPYDEAIRDFASRNPVVAESADQVAELYRQGRFTAARLTRETLVRDVQRKLIEAMEQGTRLEDFVEWFDEQVPESNFQGYAKTVFRTNVNTAYSAGRVRQMESVNESAAEFGEQPPVVGFEYVTVGDERVRENHAALDGVVFPLTKLGERFMPPNGFGCRCTAIPVFRREGITPITDAEARALAKFVDPGFFQSPTATAAQLSAQLNAEISADRITLNRWITIGDPDGPGGGKGRKVEIDEEGNVTKGLSREAQGKSLDRAIDDLKAEGDGDSDTLASRAFEAVSDAGFDAAVGAVDALGTGLNFVGRKVKDAILSDTAWALFSQTFPVVPLFDIGRRIFFRIADGAARTFGGGIDYEDYVPKWFGLVDWDSERKGPGDDGVLRFAADQPQDPIKSATDANVRATMQEFEQRLTRAGVPDEWARFAAPVLFIDHAVARQQPTPESVRTGMAELFAELEGELPEDQAGWVSEHLERIAQGAEVKLAKHKRKREKKQQETKQDKGKAKGGQWITTDNGQKVYIDANGLVQKGLSKDVHGKTLDEAMEALNKRRDQEESSAPRAAVTVNDEAALEARSRGMFGESKTPDQMRRFFGVPAGADTLKVEVDGASTRVTARKEGVFELDRKIGYGADGQLEVSHIKQRFLVTGEGRGAAVFGEAVENYQRAGVARITAAAMGNAGKEGWNGYYTWARFGFDGPLSEEQSRKAAAHGLLVSGNEGLRAPKRVQEIMQVGKTGIDYWREHGSALDLTFDLRDDSVSMDVWRKYQREKASE